MNHGRTNNMGRKITASEADQRRKKEMNDIVNKFLEDCNSKGWRRRIEIDEFSKEC